MKNIPKLILSHPTANNFARAAARSFIKSNILYEFHTGLASFPGSFLDKIGGLGPFSEIRRRGFDSSFKPFIRTSPLLETGRLIALKSGIKYLVRHEDGIFSVDSVYRNMDLHVASRLKSVAKKGVNAVYAYEDGALATFTEAKSLGMTCVYDLPIAYWETGRRLMQEEAHRLPAWATTLGGGVLDSQAKLDRKIRELELADIVVVPGQFVYDSLPVWAKDKKIIIAPFGTPAMPIDGVDKEYFTNDTDRPLRVLFAGSMGQRKGLGDLFDAVKLIDNKKIELVVMGGLQASLEFYRSQLVSFTYEPGRPNKQVLELMRTCDVFCLPSIVEGRALVMQEAMSQGLPLIITANTGGSDLIQEGQTGFIVPIRSPEKIAEKLTWFIENKKEIPKMSKLAQAHAAKYTWESYGDSIVKGIFDFN